MTMGGRLLLWDRKLSPPEEVRSYWLGDHHCFCFRRDPIRVVLIDAIAAAAESGASHYYETFADRRPQDPS